ncbi:MAG: hypothetical protein AAGH79_07130 [Bacteroidota bacterium]
MFGSILKTNNSLFQLVALFLMLIALPAGSWYYLKGGETFYLETIKSLDSLGVAQPIPTPMDPVTNADATLWKKKVSIVSGWPTEQKAQASYLDVMQRLNDQFSKRPDIQLVTYVNTEGSTFSEEAFEAQYQIEHPEQWRFLGWDGQSQPYQAAFHLPSDANPQALVSLLDTGLQVRHHYAYQDAEAVKLLIRHITYVMPRLPERDVEFEREQEK